MQLDLFTPSPEALALDPRADLRTIPADYRALVKELRAARAAEERERTLAAKQRAQAAAIVTALNELTAPIPPDVWTTLQADGHSYLDIIDAPGAWADEIDWHAVLRRFTALAFIDAAHYPQAAGHFPTTQPALDRFLQLITARLRPASHKLPSA